MSDPLCSFETCRNPSTYYSDITGYRCASHKPGSLLATARKSAEAVSHPAHYGGADNPYEAIKVIEAWDLGFHLGNAVKYISRAGRKGDEIEDLRKAAWYLQRQIENLGGVQQPEETRDIELNFLRREVQMLRDVLSGNYWRWQGDGEDHLESLSCPVIIDPQQLTRILEAAR